MKYRQQFLKQGDSAIARFKITDGMICLETYKDFPPMARFISRNDCQTIWKSSQDHFIRVVHFSTIVMTIVERVLLNRF